MPTKTRTSVRALLVSLAFAVLAGPAARAVEPYSVIDLGSLGETSRAFDISPSGVVVGETDLGLGHAFLYDDALHDLGTLGFPSGSTAFGVNGAGQVVGQSRVAVGTGDVTHAFLWENGVMRDLGLPGDSWSSASDINAHGQVVGTFGAVGTTPDGLHGVIHRAFLWQDGARQALPEWTEAYGVNDQGQIVGDRRYPGSDPLASLFDGTTGMRNLGTLGGQFSTAQAINNAGQVVGGSHTAEGAIHAFLYENGAMRDLGTLPGGHYSWAWAINASGQVVGNSDSGAPSAGRGACLWEGGRVYDLNDWIPEGSGWRLGFAMGINDRGLIVGEGTSSASSAMRAFLLVPLSVQPPRPPAAPTSFTVRASSPEEHDRLDLFWTDRSNTEAGFEIQRRTDGGEWTTLHTTAPNEVAYSDTGLAPFTRYRYRLRAVNAAGASDWTAEAAGETGIGPVVSVSPTEIEFDKQSVGSSSRPQSIFLTNRGNGTLTIQRVAFTGTGRQEFSLGATIVPKVLQPGQTRELRVTFTPSATGSWLAALTIETDSAESPHVVSLSGAGGGPSLKIGVAAAELPDGVYFGTFPLGATGVVKSLTLTNTGTSPLSIRSIRLSSAVKGEFAVVSGHKAGTLAPGRSRTLTVRFTPMRPGTRTAVLTVTHNGENSPQDVVLTGEGFVSQEHTAARALHPVAAKIVVTAIDGTSPKGTLRPIAGQSLTLALQLRYRNGAVAELTDGSQVRFTASGGRGTFTAANVWRALPADAGHRVDLFGLYSADSGGSSLRARLSMKVQR
jgi:probable HAF family extracellular repeat protein